MREKTRFFTLFIMSTVIGHVTAAHAKSIYGPDNRRSVTEPTREAKAVGMLVSDFLLDEAPPSSGLKFKLNTDQFVSSGINDQTRFADERSIGYCTTFLVAPKLMMTASHCFDEVDRCENTVVLFDYYTKDKASWTHSEARHCKKVLASTKPTDVDFTDADSFSDFVLFELDEPIFDRVPLSLSTAQAPVVGQDVWTIGHPRGRALKIADQAKIFRIENKNIVTNIDGFHGNSGSPILDAITNQVIAIYSSGDEDNAEHVKQNELRQTMRTITDQTYAETPTYGEHASQIILIWPIIRSFFEI